MSEMIIEARNQMPIEQQRVEIVERKGLGHPDSICDAIMEHISVTLCREYLKTFGKILHHNIDKGLLVAGRTAPRLGGGTVLEPMRLVVGDRATAEYQGKKIDINAIVTASVQEWVQKNLRFVDPQQHLIIQNELKESSAELVDLFERETIGANDTSVAVGYAPLTQTEQLILKTERYLNQHQFKKRFPAAGEDVKVMGYRCDRRLVLTVALAFVDRYIPDTQTYFAQKAAIQADLEAFIKRQSPTFEAVKVCLNLLDDPNRGEGGMYLTVLGTSAEAGDGGQVGRGNHVNGVIALNRPMSTEAAAGKNPVSHVGKIYSLLTHHIATKLHHQLSEIQEVYVWLGSQIGQPLDQPAIVSVQVVPQPGCRFEGLRDAIAACLAEELANIHDFTLQLVQGKFPVW